MEMCRIDETVLSWESLPFYSEKTVGAIARTSILEDETEIRAVDTIGTNPRSIIWPLGVPDDTNGLNPRSIILLARGKRVPVTSGAIARTNILDRVRAIMPTEMVGLSERSRMLPIPIETIAPEALIGTISSSTDTSCNPHGTSSTSGGAVYFHR